VGKVPVGLGLPAPDADQRGVGAADQAALPQDRAQRADRLGGLVPLAHEMAGLAAVVEEQLGGRLGAGAVEPLPDQELADLDAGGRRVDRPPLATGLPVLATLVRFRCGGEAVGRADHGKHRLWLPLGDGCR